MKHLLYAVALLSQWFCFTGGAYTLTVNNLSGAQIAVRADQIYRFPTSGSVETAFAGIMRVDVGSDSNEVAMIDTSGFTFGIQNQLDLTVLESSASILQTYTPSGWCWVGFTAGFGWFGFGFILRLVRQVGKTSPEL
jgi:hypothetical protein